MNNENVKIFHLQVDPEYLVELAIDNLERAKQEYRSGNKDDANKLVLSTKRLLNGVSCETEEKDK